MIWLQTPNPFLNKSLYLYYWGIIIVYGGPKFVDFVGNHWPRIYPNLYTVICLIVIKTIPITLPTKLHSHEPGKFWLPTNIENDSTVYIIEYRVMLL